MPPAEGIPAAAVSGIAAVLVMGATRMSAESEVELVIEVRDLALEDNEAEPADGVAKARCLAENVHRIASASLSFAAQTLLGPILSVMVKSLKT